MSDKKINLEEILFACGDIEFSDSNKWYTNESILKAMKEACRQTLELAAENANVTINSIEDLKLIVDKQSILNTINQIE